MYFKISNWKRKTSQKETNLKENEKGQPIWTYANTLVQGPRRRSPSQENKQKTGRDQSPNVTSRNTNTNNLSNEEPTPFEKKIQFLSPNKGKQARTKHQQEATPKLTTLKTNKQNNKQKKPKNSRKK